jgi:predicted PurR-regulated permease PerM
MNRLRPKLEQNLGWAALLALAAGCLVVLHPSISALLWAVVLSVSSWPFYSRLVRWLGQRRTLAAMLLRLAMALVLLLPFVIVGMTLADNVKDLTAATHKWLEKAPPAPPAWLAKIPAVGQKAATYWQRKI